LLALLFAFLFDSKASELRSRLVFTDSDLDLIDLGALDAFNILINV
jgi:hypothetical protein